MKKTNLLILLLIVLLGILGGIIYQQQRVPKQEPATVPPPTPAPTPIKQPIIHYPVPEPATPEPAAPKATLSEPKASPPAKEETLPPIQDGDQAIEQVLPRLVSDRGLFELLNADNFIQRFVAMIDNLPEKRLPRLYMPLKPPGGRFIVSGTADAPQTSSRNHKRYQRYVELLENMDPNLVLNIYMHFYPLFQHAYEQLGYKNAYFNDRLIFTLDHLLETPDPKEPILLNQPSVLYTYADPLLENRSAGQKILIRIGPANRAKVLKILADYRRRLSHLHP